MPATVVNANIDQLPGHIAGLLHLATRRVRAEAEARARTFQPLRASEARLLDLIPATGGRATDLALQLRISKQGLGQIVAQLVSAGYVEVLPDPADKRARLVLRTTTGDYFRKEVRSLLAEVEDRWRDEVGADRYATFRAVLHELATTPPQLPW